MMALQAEHMPGEVERRGISVSCNGSAIGHQDDSIQDMIPSTPSKLKSSKFSPRAVGMRALSQFYSLTGTGSLSSPLKSNIRSPRKVVASILKRSSTTTTALERQNNDAGSSRSSSDADSLCSSAMFGMYESEDEEGTMLTSEMQA